MKKKIESNYWTLKISLFRRHVFIYNPLKDHLRTINMALDLPCNTNSTTEIVGLQTIKLLEKKLRIFAI